MGNLLLQRIQSTETPTPADETPSELTGPTDGVRTFNSTSSSKMAGLPMVEVNFAFPQVTAPRRGSSSRDASS